MRFAGASVLVEDVNEKLCLTGSVRSSVSLSAVVSINVGAGAADRPARLPDPAALLAAEVALHDHLALARRGAGDEQVDAPPDRRRVGARERDLLPDDRRQVAVEGEHELLELRALGVVHAEHVGAVEAEERVDAAVVQEAEAADLPAEARGVAIPEE